MNMNNIIRSIHFNPFIVTNGIRTQEEKRTNFFEELPKIVCLDNQNLKLLCATVGSMSHFSHFRSYFLLEKNYFIVNDI